jgi:hypothetical protein
VLTDSDVIARISIISKQRYLVFSPTETAFGKDPAGLAEVALPSAGSPDYTECLAGIISQIKERLNALSEAQVARKQEVEWFSEHLPKIDSADDINGLLGRAKDAGRDIARLLHDRATEIGLTFDRASGEYTLHQKEAA